MGQAYGSTNMMAVAAGGNIMGAGTSLATAIANSNAIGAQSEFEQQNYEFNAKVADIQGADAKKRGSVAASRVLAEGRKIQGSQRVAAAAQGVDPNTGTAADLQTETETFSRLDANSVRANAFQEAFGYKVDALTSRGRGKLSGIAAGFNQTTTILGGGLQGLQYGINAARYWGKS